MKNCSYCGRQNADDAVHCVECGTDLLAVIEGPAQSDREPVKMRFNLVTISTAFNPADAQLSRSRLEAAGFHAVVAHELSALSMDGYSLAAGGIRVQVPESEAAEARAFLNSSVETSE
jgi:hypothetical protein